MTGAAFRDLALPSASGQLTGEERPERRVRDREHVSVFRGELDQPLRRFLCALQLRRRHMPADADRECPADQRHPDAADIRRRERELRKQRRSRDVWPQQRCGVHGTRRGAGDDDVARAGEGLQCGGRLIAFVDSGCLVRFAPAVKSRAIDEAAVDVRGAAVSNEEDFLFHRKSR